MNNKTTVARNNEIVASDMDGEVVMMHIETGKYYNLGRIGGEIWNILEKSMMVENIVENLIVKYDVSKEQCEMDILPFLMQMEKNKLIQII